MLDDDDDKKRLVVVEVVVPGIGGLEMDVDEKVGLCDGGLVQDNNNPALGTDELERDDPDLSRWNASDDDDDSTAAAVIATTAVGL